MYIRTSPTFGRSESGSIVAFIIWMFFFSFFLTISRPIFRSSEIQDEIRKQLVMRADDFFFRVYLSRLHV